ncbi:MAG: OmpH family outer membrane protein [Saprospiraceae bacterium]|nr:OmpH family outer membrane protein [Saprospiraceae bacterium]
MKSLNPFNIVLAIAIVILYFLHFAGSGKKSETAVTEVAEDEMIYYVNVDSLNSKLDFLAEKQEVLGKKEQDADKLLRDKGAKLERDIMAYQRRAQSGELTPKQMQAEEAKFTRLQQEFMAEREAITSALLAEGQATNKELMDLLNKHITEFAEGKNIKAIFAYSEAGNILYADKKTDITDLMLEKMNKEKSGTEEPEPADTSAEKKDQ